jgi:ribosome-associated toxin RatA of RatAB toxin-antitoxin module
MFELVADVERYPEFVPFCQKHAIKARERQAGIDVLISDVTVSYGPFRDRWRSRVTLDRNESLIRVVSVNGPFRRLETIWTFRSTRSPPALLRPLLRRRPGQGRKYKTHAVKALTSRVS